MTGVASDAVLAAFLVFCRVGACLMLMPGFGSSHLPTRIRLFVALAVSLGLGPLLYDQVAQAAEGAGPAAMVGLIVSETGIGILIGFLGRIFFLALETFAVAIAQAVGLGGLPGTVMEDGQAHPALATLFMVTATALFFAGDQHVAVIAALADSYGAMPPGTGFVARIGLTEVVDQLSETFLIALRLSSPFLILSLVLNFAVGVVNKLVPQIPVYFIAMPFVTAAGLFLLFEVMQEMMAGFLGAFAAWLAGG